MSIFVNHADLKNWDEYLKKFSPNNYYNNMVIDIANNSKLGYHSSTSLSHYNFYKNNSNVFYSIINTNSAMDIPQFDTSGYSQISVSNSLDSFAKHYKDINFGNDFTKDYVFNLKLKTLSEFINILNLNSDIYVKKRSKIEFNNNYNDLWEDVVLSDYSEYFLLDYFLDSVSPVLEIFKNTTLPRPDLTFKYVENRPDNERYSLPVINLKAVLIDDSNNAEYYGEAVFSPIIVQRIANNFRIERFNNILYKCQTVINDANTIILQFKTGSDGLNTVYHDEGEEDYLSLRFVKKDFITELLNSYQIPFTINNHDLAVNGSIEDFPDYDSDLNGNIINNDIAYPDNYTENIDFPEIPNINVLDTGLLTIYRPDINQLKAISNLLYNPDVYEVLNQVFSKAIDGILSLKIIPFKPPASTLSKVVLGKYTSNIDCPKIDEQYHIVNFGDLQLKKYYADFSDYEPYSKLKIFIPFVGEKYLNINECLDNSLNLKYIVDILTGTATAILTLSNSLNSKSIYKYPCNVSSEIPLSAADYTSFINALITGVQSRGHLLLTSTLNSEIDIERTGNLNSNNGMLSGLKPYITIEHSLKALPSNYSKYLGNPSEIEVFLKDLKGFTQIEKILLNFGNITDSEKNELYEIMKEGIYL